jgi:ATP-dependent DNA helicase RecQ
MNSNIQDTGPVASHSNPSVDLHTSLKQVFGFEEFRPGQQQTIRQLLAGHSSLAIFPTGSGKSLCYQFTALHLPHLTLVVSPLLALMKDQLEFLAAKGIAAASIDSSLSFEQSKQVMQDVQQGKLKILMVSVERFKNERFRQLIQSVPLSMLVIDEAHCISEWGHNFRPDYLKLPAYRQQLNIPTVLLLTATATAKVKKDMAKRFAIEPSQVVQTGFYRANLDLTVLPLGQRDKDQGLLDSVRSQQGCGIVYVTLQQSAEQVARFLAQQGIVARAYHAGLEGELRQSIQQDFMQGKIQVVVATIAFGMGIDKADIRFVIHYDLPKSIENYSQEIGRAGRDGRQAQCVFLANLDGLNTLENFVYGDTPELQGIEYVLNNIRQESQDGQWEMQLNGLSNDSNIRQLPLKTMLVQLELLGVIKSMYSYFADFKYKILQTEQHILNLFEGERADFLKAVFQHTRFKRVWGEVDFEGLFQNYGCERGRVVTALEYLQQQGLLHLETKLMTEVYQVDSQKLLAANLAAELYQYFNDKEQKEIKRIAALIRFFELDSCLSYNLSRYFDANDAPQKCGHCSVCRAQIAKLERSALPSLPEVSQITLYLQGLAQQLSTKADYTLTQASCCRFLAGISVPVFARYKVRQLPGFACCERYRYAEIRELVSSAWQQINGH